MRGDVEFDADGTTLRGWLYTPDKGTPPFPAVVMAHGFSALKEMGLDQYAEVFAAVGLSALVYDNRNLGASDGNPRLKSIRPLRCETTGMRSRTRSLAQKLILIASAFGAPAIPAVSY